MTKGVNITLQEKLDINQRRLLLGRSPFQVWQEQFLVIILEYLFIDRDR